MKQHIDFYKRQREQAEDMQYMKVYKNEAGGKFYVLLFKPRAINPFGNYYFNDEASRGKYIAKNLEALKNYQEEHKKLRQEWRGTNEQREKIKVGDIFCCSWGYEQTNVDFYQVVFKSTAGATVGLREIACESVGLTGNSMADHVIPRKDVFITNAPIIKKRVQFSGGNPVLTMSSYSSASLWRSDSKPEYRSWYA
jgi:hypothetical protein